MGVYAGPFGPWEVREEVDDRGRIEVRVGRWQTMGGWREQGQGYSARCVLVAMGRPWTASRLRRVRRAALRRSRRLEARRQAAITAAAVEEGVVQGHLELEATDRQGDPWTIYVEGPMRLSRGVRIVGHGGDAGETGR